MALGSSVFALFPDLDHPQSLLGRIFPGLSKYILKKYGHRTVTHSVFSVLVLSLLFTPVIFFAKTFYFASIIAYSSHIFIDLFNRSGVKLFAPYSQKEYISFRTDQLRILVSSWQEYLLLFIIVFLAFSVSGRSFSMAGAVRSVSKLFYKNFDNAVRDFQENSRYLNNARITYFDHSSRKKIKVILPVLNIFPDKIYVLEHGGRKIITKADIKEIEIIKTENKIDVWKITGKSLEDLSKIEPGSFVSGKIIVYGFVPEIKNSGYVKILKGTDRTVITVTCAEPHELVSILYMNQVRENRIKDLKGKLSSYQAEQLKNEEGKILKRINLLKSKGFYANYSNIIKLNGELKKIQSRIDTLNMRVASGADEAVLREIEDLKEFKVTVDLWVLRQ